MRKTIIYSAPGSNVRPAPEVFTPGIVGALLDAIPARANDHSGGGGERRQVNLRNVSTEQLREELARREAAHG